MAEDTHSEGTALESSTGTWQSLVADWSSDRDAFKRVSSSKAMMWIFLVSDTFVFGCFLAGYMGARSASGAAWPDTSEVFALTLFGTELPLILIAIMTFVLITSSGTMAMAVNHGYGRERQRAATFLVLTALLGATFVGMQAFEWTELILHKHVRPWETPMGADQFGATFFMITGFHGAHVSIGVIYLLVVARKVLRGDYDRSGSYEPVETAGLYWHFVDLVWVFIFAFFYLL